jgi:hypothetical protein
MMRGANLKIQGICINDLCFNNEKVHDLYFPLFVVVVIVVFVVVVVGGGGGGGGGGGCGGGGILTSHEELKSDICVLVVRQLHQHSSVFVNGLMSTETSFIVALYSGTCLYWNCKGSKFVYVASRFCLLHILEVRIRRTPDPRECKSFPIKTGSHYAKVPLKTGFFVLYYKKELRFCDVDDLQCVLTIALFCFQDCGLW